MSRSESAGWRRVPIQLSVAAVVVAGLGGALAGAAIADDDDVPTVEPASDRQAVRLSTGGQAAEAAQLREIVLKMPAGWPATEAMRQAAAEYDWRHVVDLMPAGWPATEVMRERSAP
jgi:hypothetical protein